MTKQERLTELQLLRQEAQQSIKELTLLLAIANSSSGISSFHPSPYDIKVAMVREKRYHISIKLDSEKERLQRIEKEYAKIEAMSEDEAETYIKRYKLKQKGSDVLLKTLEVISDMTPEPIGGRLVRVNDNFLKYWLIVIAVGFIIFLIVMGSSGNL